jgi:hypothetical protein
VRYPKDTSLKPAVHLFRGPPAEGFNRHDLLTHLR